MCQAAWRDPHAQLLESQLLLTMALEAQERTQLKRLFHLACFWNRLLSCPSVGGRTLRMTSCSKAAWALAMMAPAAA